MKVTDFEPGDAVRYVPNHAHGDATHKDCENGIVSSRNDKFVFVRYYVRRDGRDAGLQLHAQATDPCDLRKP